MESDNRFAYNILKKMEALNAKDFMDKLQHGTLRPACILKGVVKQSEKNTEILFKAKGSMEWTKIPASMIGSVIVKKNITWAEESMTVVKLILKAPTTPEAMVFFELLTGLMPKEKCDEPHEGGMHGCTPFGKGSCSTEHSYFGGHCHCGCGCKCNCGMDHGCHCHH